MKPIVALFAACLTILVVSSAHAETMKPGLWEISTQIHSPCMPAMPKISHAEPKQMEAMGIKIPQAGAGGGINVTTKTCVTAEQAKKGVPPSAGNEQEKCEQTDIKTSGKTTSWKMVCTGKHSVAGTGSVTYESAEKFSGETTLNMQDGKMGPMTMTNKFSGKYVGAECPQQGKQSK